MSTTVGVSEIMADTYETREPYETFQYETENTHSQSSFPPTSEIPDLSNHPEYRTSYGGDSSHHDDVAPEDEEEEDGEEVMAIQPPHDLTAKPYTEFANIEPTEIIHQQLPQEQHQQDENGTGLTKIETLETGAAHSGYVMDLGENGTDSFADEEGTITKMSFNEIREDLERKNVVGSLQPLHPGQYLMHHQSSGMNKQDVIAINPQTGEPIDIANTAHPFAKAADMNMASNSTPAQGSGTGVNGTGGSTPPSQQHTYPYRGQDAGSGGANPSQTVGGNSGSGGTGPAPSAYDRARQVYNMYECQMAHLTVFLDRALVCRRIRPRFNASEITEVLFEHLSPAIDKDSIRVEIRGAATILDVSFNARSISGEEDTCSQTISDLMQELRQCKRQADNLLNRIGRAEKQRAVLDTFAGSLIRRDEETASSAPTNVTPPVGIQNHHAIPPIPNSVPNAPTLTSGDHKGSLDTINPYDPRNMETLNRFLSVYEEQAERLDATLMDSTEELDQVRARIEVIEKEIHDVELKQDEHLSRELSVLVEPRETGQVEMLVSYVVGRCGWTPAYDIRIFNSDGTMKIVYYGMVQQATGEDWETRTMTLSTAMPGIGGMVPHLGLQRVHFRRDHSPAVPSRNTSAVSSHQAVSNSAAASAAAQANKARTAAKLGGFRRSNRTNATSFHESDRLITESERETSTPSGTLQRGSSIECAYTPGLRSSSTRNVSRRTLGASMLFNSSTSGSPLMSNRVSTLNSALPNQQQQQSPPSQTGNIATVQLEVPRPPALIRCDNEPNRVTVGLLDLQPHYEYMTVPKRSLHAYLKATATNRTDFSILAGPTNIYADNTFIGKSEIRAVAPGEEFTCHLGAETGIKVIYRPLFKYREGTGSSGKNATMTFKQLIEVRNTFDRPIRLMVVDQVPVSGEDKIKISLLEPVIKHPEKYDKNKPIRMNKSNNVEWDLDLGPGEHKELTLKYSVEHPINEDLDVSVCEA